MTTTTIAPAARCAPWHRDCAEVDDLDPGRTVHTGTTTVIGNLTGEDVTASVEQFTGGAGPDDGPYLSLRVPGALAVLDADALLGLRAVIDAALPLVAGAR